MSSIEQDASKPNDLSDENLNSDIGQDETQKTEAKVEVDVERESGIDALLRAAEESEITSLRNENNIGTSATKHVLNEVVSVKYFSLNSKATCNPKTWKIGNEISGSDGTKNYYINNGQSSTLVSPALPNTFEVVAISPTNSDTNSSASAEQSVKSPCQSSNDETNNLVKPALENENAENKDVVKVVHHRKWKFMNEDTSGRGRSSPISREGRSQFKNQESRPTNEEIQKRIDHELFLFLNSQRPSVIKFAPFR